MATNQFDNYQLNPNEVADDWAFADDHIHANRPPNAKMSNPAFYRVGGRMTRDYTRTLFGSPDPRINPQREINDGFLGHGVDWALFNYNPYGKTEIDGKNPNFRVKNDWLQITGMGDITVVTDDVMDQDEVKASGMVQYRNYPSEGYSSFGKTTGGASPDKRWIWQGNTWVPGASAF